MALVSYNVLSVVKAALRSVHGVEAVEEVSGYYLADEIAGTHRGMMIAIPADEWVVFAGLGVWSRVVFGDFSGGGLLPDAVDENGPLDDLGQQRRTVQRSPTL